MGGNCKEPRFLEATELIIYRLTNPLTKTQRLVFAFNINKIRAIYFDMSLIRIRSLCPNDIPVNRTRRNNDQPNFLFFRIIQNDFPFVLQEREFRINPINVFSFIS